MSTHPNVILLAILTPDDLSRKTMRDILADEGIEDSNKDIKINGIDYSHLIMESEYEEGYQISGKEGDLLFFDLITYGYGEFVTWEKLEAQKQSLEDWAKQTSEKHHCSYEIRVSANYW